MSSKTNVKRCQQPDLFGGSTLAPGALSTVEPGVDGPGKGSVQGRASAAEKILLDLADFVYAHTSLKPMSKALFLISRCLLVVRSQTGVRTPAELGRVYRKILTDTSLSDDFALEAVAVECREHLGEVMESLERVHDLTRGTDSLGLTFNTLLRGKFEGGEGLGTYLTPEEVSTPMVDMLLASVDAKLLGGLRDQALLYGDICGGTGRFVYALAKGLRSTLEGVSIESARLFDQSSMAVDFARLNFLFDGAKTSFECVGDSLTASAVSVLRGRFALLATNPPFGSGKHRWTPELERSLPAAVLRAIGLAGPSDAADPAELFFFRNLDLLAIGGALAIVLPDGVVQSARFKNTLEVYEREARVALHVAAIVSLPVATFTLGGTVAKTSFIIVRKDRRRSDAPLYVASAAHVGFKKRGNRRIPDLSGNDLERIAHEFVNGETSLGACVGPWHAHERLVGTKLAHASEVKEQTPGSRRLAESFSAVRDYRDAPGPDDTGFHVSILDVDETGLIDVIAASRNKPVSKGVACKPGDVLVSCLNPMIWRVAVVPDLGVSWSCSPEFLVLRPKRLEEAWRLGVTLHDASVARAVQALAGGTSSSRQRVPKDKILDVDLPVIDAPDEAVAEHAAFRTDFYVARLKEAEAYRGLHEGSFRFYM